MATASDESDREGDSDTAGTREPGAPESDPSVLPHKPPASRELGWTTVWNCRDSAEANLAVGKLLAMGLHARVDMENTAALGPWGGAGPVGSTNIQTIAADVEAARRYLTEIDHRRERRQQAAQARCPRCGSHGGERKMSAMRWVAVACIPAAIVTGAVGLAGVSIALVTAAAFLAIWPFMPRWRCAACGNRWAAPDPDSAAAEDDDEPDEDAGEQGDGKDEADGDIAPSQPRS